MPIACRAALVATLALAATASPALAGPPWISVELPANPMDRTTKGAYLLVHSYHHERAIALAVRGRAEGLVNGERRTIPLELERTAREGVFAVRQSWPKDGNWVLVLSVGDERGPATALVAIGRDGEVRSVRVPSRQQDGWTVPEVVTPADVDRALRTLAQREAGGAVQLGMLGGVMLLGLVGLVRRR